MRGMIGLLLWGVVLGCGSSGSTSSPPQGKADTASPSTDTEKPEDTSTPALETREIPTSGECLTGQVCIDDSDCGAGERCNATLSPPGCHKAYCSGAGQGCDPAHGDALCLPDLFCVETPTAAAPFCADCKPECEGKQCGDDGCGGVCGACEEGLSCTEMSLCDCLPDCDGKQCGEDGCGGFCGTCPEGVLCLADAQCDCEPVCGESVCGDDGCGGTCGECVEGTTCVGGACCTPQCDGKQCGDDSCGGVCGTCGEGDSCVDELCCTPSCEGEGCGEDGCGGLCNGCLELNFDDGTTETAFGYSSEPSFSPEKVACLVRFELPMAGMKLTEFTAGWMWGLYNLEVPFEIVYLPGDAVSCEAGDEEDWYIEYCESTPDQMVSIGSFVPKEPYTPHTVEELGEVILPHKTVYLGALFAVDAYPIYVCPVDASGTGAHSFMMPQTVDGDGGTKLEAAALKKKAEDPGVIPFRLRVDVVSE